MRIPQRILQNFLQRYGLEVHRVYSESNTRKTFSNLEEQSRIAHYLERLKVPNKSCVDIGAGDGVTMSNTFALFLDGWQGLAIEYDPTRFAHLARTYLRLDVNIARCKVVPENVLSLLEGHEIPKQFGLLSLDIDGYDYFVLQQILSKFRPSLICTEVNEKIPPPLKFTVQYDPGYAWAGDHFYGQSISQLDRLCSEHDYALVELHYNNAFLVPRELNSFPDLTAEEAYVCGYLERKDRKEKFPWNANLEQLQTMSPDEAMGFLKSFFSQYEGKFVCTL
jgi:hypothetical protein